jgi:hypothetical protein
MHEREPLYRNMQWLQGGLVFMGHRLLYNSTPGSRLIKKREQKKRGIPGEW